MNVGFASNLRLQLLELGSELGGFSFQYLGNLALRDRELVSILRQILDLSEGQATHDTQVADIFLNLGA